MAHTRAHGHRRLELPQLELREGFVAFRLGEETAFSRAIDRVAAALQLAAAGGHRQMLACGAHVRFRSPSIAARHSMVRTWARAADGRVVLAMVTRPDLIDPDRFGVVAAANFGLVGQVFCKEENAVEWFASRLARHHHGVGAQR